MFITHLHSSGYSSSTIHTYSSAVNHIHRVAGGSNFMQDFMVKKLLDAVSKTSHPTSRRAPIDVFILDSLIRQLQLLHMSPYDTLLYQTTFLLLFYLAARIGELASSRGNVANAIRLQDVSWFPHHHTGAHYLISFINFKHNKDNSAHQIPLRPTSTSVCPVSFLSRYLTHRGSSPGPLLITSTGSPISDYMVNQLLHSTLLMSQLDPSEFGSHSFRIGRVTDLANTGLSA